MTHRIARNALAAGLALVTVNAQSPPRPQFEVATIKPSPRELKRGSCASDFRSPGRLAMKCMTVTSLIQVAYGLLTDGVNLNSRLLQVSGGPAWINSDQYDIAAKAEGNARSEQMAGPMLQALLEDRFKLKLHREMREQPVYDLTVAKGGLKLQPGKEACTPSDLLSAASRLTPGEKRCGSTKMQMNGQTMTMDLDAMSMTEFSGNISVGLDRTVIDKTSVAGIFDFHLEFAFDETTRGFLRNRGIASTTDPGPSIFSAIQKLGLKLDTAKGPVEFLVIDHVEKPSEN